MSRLDAVDMALFFLKLIVQDSGGNESEEGGASKGLSTEWRSEQLVANLMKG